MASRRTSAPTASCVAKIAWARTPPSQAGDAGESGVIKELVVQKRMERRSPKLLFQRRHVSLTGKALPVDLGTRASSGIANNTWHAGECLPSGRMPLVCGVDTSDLLRGGTTRLPALTWRF